MDKGKNGNNLKSDPAVTRKLLEISSYLGRFDTKLWIIIILLAGILVVAIADL